MAEGGARWDDARAKRAYANECNVASREDEFVVSFGVTQAPQGEAQERRVEATQHILMTPHVAKRLAVLLGRLVQEHDARFGARQGRGPEGGDGVGTI